MTADQVDHRRPVQRSVEGPEGRLLGTQVVEPPARETTRAHQPARIPVQVGSTHECLGVTDSSADRRAEVVGTLLEGEKAGEARTVLHHRHPRVRPRPANCLGELRCEKSAGQPRLAMLESPPPGQLRWPQLLGCHHSHLHDQLTQGIADW